MVSDCNINEVACHRHLDQHFSLQPLKQLFWISPKYKVNALLKNKRSFPYSPALFKITQSYGIGKVIWPKELEVRHLSAHRGGSDMAQPAQRSAPLMRFWCAMPTHSKWEKSFQAAVEQINVLTEQWVTSSHLVPQQCKETEWAKLWKHPAFLGSSCPGDVGIVSLPGNTLRSSISLEPLALSLNTKDNGAASKPGWHVW